ncbi:MAG: EsaB/YukD family protein [Armatimonadota bacterium]
MGKVTVVIIDTTRGVQQRACLPDDAPVRRLIAKLVELMELPVTGAEGQSILYSLQHEGSARQLRDDETLAEAGIRDDDVLKLVPLSADLSAEADDWYREHEPGKVKVLIVDTTGNKQQRACLPDDAPVRRVIAKLVEMMGVPTHGPDGQPLSYKFHHKRSGRQFVDDQTLAEAGVQNGDVLRLAPEITAGGGPLVVCHPDMARVSCTTRGAHDEDGLYEADDVDCTVFAPPQVRVGDSAMVQVWAHDPALAQQVSDMAREFDAEARRRGVTSLGTRVRRGSRLTFELVLRELTVRDPVQEITWGGQYSLASFEVDVPTNARPGAHIGTVLISQDAVPIGEIRFKLSIVTTMDEDAASRRCSWLDPVGRARRYEMAFISYASKDRTEVLRCVRMLPAAGIRFFQDVLELEPGDRWERELWRHIDESDVMFLFWSTAARESEWVEKEWRYALEHKGDDHIRPIIIEGPPPPLPPDELKNLHFDDKLLYVLRASEAAETTAARGAANTSRASTVAVADGADGAMEAGRAYVERERGRGRSDDEIHSRLSQTGWSDEQIDALLTGKQ